MINKYKALLFFIFIFLTPLYSEVNTTKLLTSYQEAIQLGQEQFYDIVQEKTLEIIETLQGNDENIPSSDYKEVYSILTASSFYYAYYSIQKVHYDTLNMYDQVETLRAVINQLNTAILFLRNKKELNSKQSISLLFYARGFTKLYLSKQLLHAIIWKQYIVQPPRDIINLVESAEKDLKLSAKQLGVNYDEISKKVFSDNLLFVNTSNIKKSKTYHHILDKLNKLDASQLKTFSLIIQTDETKQITTKISELITSHIYKTIYFLNSKRVKNILQNSETFITYEEITSKENRPLFSAIEQSVDLSIPKLP